MNAIQHTRYCFLLYWVAICFYFIKSSMRFVNQPHVIYCVWCVSTSDVRLVVKFSYITFLIHKKTVCIGIQDALRATTKLCLLETLDRHMGCSFVKSGSFRVLRQKADSWSHVLVLTLHKNGCGLWLAKARKAISSCHHNVGMGMRSHPQCWKIGH